MAYGTGVSGDKQITAQLAGSADVKGQADVTVKIEAGSSLIRAVEQARTAMRLSGTLNANGPGSLGHSSPDAAAPPPATAAPKPASTGGASGSW
jgi:hypothetical protein